MSDLDDLENLEAYLRSFRMGGAWLAEGAVWRCPAHCPWDAHCPWEMCVWKAIAPPPGYPIPDNCLVVSAEGLANSRMAGGAV